MLAMIGPIDPKSLGLLLTRTSSNSARGSSGPYDTAAKLPVGVSGEALSLVVFAVVVKRGGGMRVISLE